MTWCEAVLAEPEHRVLLFTYHPRSLQLYAESLAYERLAHAVLGADEAAAAVALDHFRSGAVRILLLSLSEWSEGTNLQCATHVGLLEVPGPHVSGAVAVEKQAVGRAVRCGQQHAVRVVYFLFQATIEATLYAELARARASSRNSVALPEAELAAVKRCLPCEVADGKRPREALACDVDLTLD